MDASSTAVAGTTVNSEVKPSSNVLALPGSLHCPGSDPVVVDVPSGKKQLIDRGKSATTVSGASIQKIAKKIHKHRALIRKPGKVAGGDDDSDSDEEFDPD